MNRVSGCGNVNPRSHTKNQKWQTGDWECSNASGKVSIEALKSEPQVAVNQDLAGIGKVRLHYAECGSGDDLVILLHGFPGGFSGERIVAC